MDRRANLQARLEAEASEREALQKRREAIVVPAADTLNPMRQLANDLAGARGALNVGLVVAITPNRTIEVRVTKDGTAANPTRSGATLEVEADAEVDLDIGDVATVRIRGGRREAQQTAEALEARWSREVAPHLAAANVADLDGLSAKIAEAQELDASIKAKGVELESLQFQIAALADPAHTLRAASDQILWCR